MAALFNQAYINSCVVENAKKKRKACTDNPEGIIRGLPSRSRKIFYRTSDGHPEIKEEDDLRCGYSVDSSSDSNSDSVSDVSETYENRQHFASNPRPLDDWSYHALNSKYQQYIYKIDTAMVAASEYLDGLAKYLSANDINLTISVRSLASEADFPSSMSDATALKHLEHIELLDRSFNIYFDLGEKYLKKNIEIAEEIMFRNPNVSDGNRLLYSMNQFADMHRIYHLEVTRNS